MKKIQHASLVVFAVCFAGMLLWRFAVPFTDWSVRVLGILMLTAVFTATCSTVRICMTKK